MSVFNHLLNLSLGSYYICFVFCFFVFRIACLFVFSYVWEEWSWRLLDWILSELSMKSKFLIYWQSTLVPHPLYEKCTFFKVCLGWPLEIRTSEQDASWAPRWDVSGMSNHEETLGLICRRNTSVYHQKRRRWSGPKEVWLSLRGLLPSCAAPSANEK